MRIKSYMGIGVVLSAMLLTGCGSSSSDSTSVTGYDVTVERGPVLYARVMDSQGHVATEVGNGTYRFDQEPVYPISANGGFIDVNRDGVVSAGDVNNSVTLKAPKGKAATLVNTIAANEEIRTWLKENFNLDDETIDNETPSTNETIAAISDEVFAYCVKNSITDPSTLTVDDLNALRDQIKARLIVYTETNQTVEDIEQELVTELVNEGVELHVLDEEESTRVRTEKEREHGEKGNDNRQNGSEGHGGTTDRGGDNAHGNGAPNDTNGTAHGSGGGKPENAGSDAQHLTPEDIASQTPTYELNADQKYALAYMWNEEKLAKDVYLALHTLTQEQVFYTIATQSETEHEAFVEALVKKYDINITNLEDYTISYSEEELHALPAGEFAVPEVQELYNTLYEKGQNSVEEALQVGCMVEVTDVVDLNNYINIAGDASDLVEVFTNLRNASYSHYWAFDKALKDKGITDGCCSLGAEYCKTPEEFPVEHGSDANTTHGQSSDHGQSGDQGHGKPENAGSDAQHLSAEEIASQTPEYLLSDEQKHALAYMWNEEKLAKDIYLTLHNETQNQIFYNIATRSETEHEAMVEALVQKYDINITNLDDYTVNYSEEELRALPMGQFAVPEVQELYDALYEKGTQSEIDALQVGCMVEVTDVVDLNNYINIAGDASDLVEVFTNLRNASYSHYWAFDKALKDIGVTDGCCSLGTEYCKTPEEFPVPTHGQHN